MHARVLLLVFTLWSRHRTCGSAPEDPLLNKLRSQLMADNYDYEKSESIENALREGAAQDTAPRAEDPSGNAISDESELSDFSMDRNVLNGYITDLSDINIKPMLRAYDDTFTADGQEPDAAQEEFDQTDVRPKVYSEAEREDTPPKRFSVNEAPAEEPKQWLDEAQLSSRQPPSQKQAPAKRTRPVPPRQADNWAPLEQAPVMPSQPDQPADEISQADQAPVMRSQPDQPLDEISQADQAPVIRSQPRQPPADISQAEQAPAEPVMQSQPEELAQPEAVPVEGPSQQGLPVQRAPQRRIRVISPFLVHQQTTEKIPYKVLTARGQKQGRRGGSEVVGYLQTQLNDTVVVAPLGPGPLPDFQLPKGRRQYREVSDDEYQDEPRSKAQL